LIAGAFVFIVMRTWTRGRVIVTDLMHRQGRTVPQFLAQIERDKPARVPGVAVFLTNDTAGIPRTLARNLQHNGVVHEKTILLSVQTRVCRASAAACAVRCRKSARACGASSSRLASWSSRRSRGSCATPNAAACRSGPTTPRSSLPAMTSSRVGGGGLRPGASTYS